MTKPISSVLADAEIERRIEAIEAGRVALEPWDEVRRRIEQDILGR